MTKRLCEAERKDFVGTYGTMRSDKYFGAWPFIHLKVNTRILNWMRDLIGSQCRFLSVGVICSYLLQRETSRQQSFAISLSFIPASKLLQL